MYKVAASVTLLGAAAHAAPWGPPGHDGLGPHGSASPAASSAAATVSASPFPTLTLLESSAFAAPTGTIENGIFEYPLSNGFPNIDNPSDELNEIEGEAGGTLPNGAPPPSISGDSLVSLGFVAFNELSEVAFFSELVQNITNNVPGFQEKDIPIDRNFALQTLKVVLAQEELHELNANGAFNKFTGQTIQPCKYNFPVSNFVEAITLATTFTDVVLGTLPDIQTIFADNDDNGLIRGVGSVIGEEGEQNGFYRQILGKIPPQLPFLTGGTRDFAFSAIVQMFAVPGSCPSQALLQQGVNGGKGLTLFGALNVLTKDLSVKDVKAEFSISTVDASQTESYYQSHKDDKVFITYINQQNVPVSEPIEDVSFSDGVITFKALFPGETNFLNGFTIAALTTSAGPFMTPDDVADVTLFGPGLIEIN